MEVEGCVTTQLCGVEVRELKPKYEGQVMYEGISLKDYE